MRKSTVFISAVLTTFALAVLYSVVSAYRGSVNTAEAAALPTATSIPTETSVPTQVVVTAVEAAQLAAQVVGNSNLLSAESSSFNGLDAYKITFTNKDVAYVGLDGQILSLQVAPVMVNLAPPAKHKKNHNNDGQNTVSTQSSHKDYEEHD